MKLFAFAWCVILLAAACGNDPTSAPCTLTPIGASCLSDTDCCSGWCQLYESAAYCQVKPGVAPACISAGGLCTQNRNCCEGLCQNGLCFGSTGPACLELGSSCIQDDSCCSNDCMSDGLGHTACATPPQTEGGPTCGLPGSPCTLPGQPDPSECCFGVCGSNNACAGGGGGGGTNCGPAGSFCRYGSDCCSSICEQSSNGSGSCH